MTSFPPFPTNLPTVPLIRISYERLVARDPAAADALLDAAEGSGFFQLDFSGSSKGDVTLNDIQKGFDIGKEFFDEDPETKKLFKTEKKSLGYTPPGAVKVSDNEYSTLEIAGVPRDSVLDRTAEPPLPAVFDSHRAFLSDMSDKLHRVAVAVFENLERSLEIPAGSFDARHDFSAPSGSQFRFLHYPAAKSSRKLSLLGHTDSGSLTILFTNLGGLQVLPPGKREDESSWQWVKPEPGCAIVNIADALVSWSGGILRSGFHRVVPSPAEQAAFDRYSWGYFLKPANDAKMARVNGGSIIPKPTAEEAKEEQEMPTYVGWHGAKYAATIAGRNDVKSMGGIRRLNQGVSV